MNAILIDSFSRKVKVSTVSVTQVAGKGLVLRYGAEVGNLWQLTEGAYDGVFRNADMPIIVATRGYTAQSSAGFVDVVTDYRGDNTRIRTHVVGIQGMPFQKKKGLSAMSNPMEVIVLRPGTNIAALDTHARRKPGEGWHSNPETANAAIQGIKLRAAIRPNSVFVLEGQSDYAQAWELAAEHETYKDPFEPDFPEEFRAERFTEEAFVAAALRAKSRRKAESDEEAKGTYFVYLNLLLADGKFWSDGKCWADQLLPEFTRRLTGERLGEIIKSIADAMRDDGWRLGIDTTVANHFLQAMSPEGKVVVSGWGAVHGPKEYEAGLIALAEDLSEEMRSELLAKLEAQNSTDRGWIAHVGA